MTKLPFPIDCCKLGLNFREGFYLLSKFREIKPSQKGEITLSFTNVGKSCHLKSRILNVAKMFFYAIRGNKILAKTSEFTV